MRALSNFQYCKFEYANKTGSGGVFNIGNGNNISIKNCKFGYNITSEQGGAIFFNYLIQGSYTIDANMFYNNQAQNGGGAIYIQNGVDINLTNNIFTQNSAYNGGAVYIDESSGKITNCTFYNNNVSNDGSEVYLFISTSSFPLNNSIFWNTAGSGSINLVFYSNQNSEIENCIITRNELGTNNSTTTGIVNCDDPFFTNPDMLNFSVQANSDAVNNGNNANAPLGNYDYAGNQRIYSDVAQSPIDIGAYELQAEKLEALAGSDVSECASTQTLYDYYPPINYTREWTVLGNSGAYITPGMSTDLSIHNLPPGNVPVEIMLSVTNGIVTVTDTVSFSNTQPIVDAGDDIILINADPNNNVYPDTVFTGNVPDINSFGLWSQIGSSSPDPIIQDPYNYQTDVTGIHYGIRAFKWNITNEVGCVNSDTLILVAGHAFTSNPDDGILDWDNPNDWNVQAVPGEADSVIIYNCTANINIPDAVCDRLYIGSGADVNLEGTAKAAAGFSCRTIFIEQNAEKFKGVKGVANLNIKDNATLNIGSNFLNKTRSSRGSGLFIGGGGTVFIEQNAEKSTKGSTGLNIGSGAYVFIEQNAEKGTRGVAELRIGSGAYVFIEQNAEKDKKIYEKGISKGDLFIGSGGYVFIEQNAEKAGGGYLHLGGGRTIFIEQNAEKKNTKGFSHSGLYLGSGGTIFIEQNAEKALSVPELIVPEMYIHGGQVRVGNNDKSKAVSGRLRFRQIFIEQNAEKDFLNDTAIVVYPNGGFSLSDSTFMPPMMSMHPYLLKLENGAAVSFMEGSEINLKNSTNWEEASILLDKATSFVDRNNDSRFNCEVLNVFKGGIRQGFSSSIEGTNASSFGENISIGTWNEQGGMWNPVINFDPIVGGVGYFVTPSANDIPVFLEDTVNTGNFMIPLTSFNPGGFAYSGWNLLGNPYPSGLDFEEIDIPFMNMHSNFYTMQSGAGNFSVYQKGGITINDGNQYISPNSVFFVKTDGPAVFNFSNNARVHYTQANSSKETYVSENTLKLTVSGNSFSDETAIVFNENATNGFDKEYDAVKMLNITSSAPVLASVITGIEGLIAINTFAFETGSPRIVPLIFTAGTSGTYTIDVSELTFGESVSVFLKDLTDNSMYNLRTNPTNNFDFDTGDDSNRFQLIFDGFSGVENIENENTIKIFSDKNIIFVNSKYENAKVEVYNINGQLLLQKNVSTKGLSSINTNLANGIYIVKVSSKEESITEKVVLSK